MPKIIDEKFKAELDEILEEAISIELNLSVNEKERALKICDEYMNGSINIHDMSPLSIYYVISKLSENEQIEFFKKNIDYIKQNDKDVFLYNLVSSPRSLSYFLSLKVLKEIRILDSYLFKKIINGSQENLFYGFSHEDYLEFYNVFFDDILEMDNIKFINSIYFHNRCCYDNNGDINNLKSILELQPIYNKHFIEFLIKKYKSKISSFTPSEMLNFIECIEDLDNYKIFIDENYDRLNEGFKNISKDVLNEYLSEANDLKQELLIHTFFDSIIKKQDIKSIIYRLNPKIVIELYNKNKEVFDTMTLLDWIKFCSSLAIFNGDFKNILDTFEINNIELLFDTNFFTSYHRKNIDSLKYIEKKYRENIKINGVLEQIDETTSIFSEKYFKNMGEIKRKLMSGDITKNDKQYKMLLYNFTLFLKNQNVVNIIGDNDFKEIEKLFYRIIIGSSIAIVYQLSNIEEIAVINRIGNIDFDVKDFTVRQLEKYNVKQHKQLCKLFEKSDYNIKYYKRGLILKLIFMVGYNHAKSILEINDTMPVLEHLVGNVDVKDVILNEQGNPILNNKIMNLLFSDKNNSKIKEMLSNQDNDLYKYFPRIFSEWKMIQINGKDKSLKIILEFLKSDEIMVPPEYYRLVGMFKYIGCSDSIVTETLTLHDQMLNRTSSSIPRIIGSKGDYTYEILKLDDMKGLIVGNKTDCCFTVLGNGYSCLKHAVTSKNGRILIVKKNNEILAHSWLWRNGDLLCFDNIEISKTIHKVDFFDVYLKLADEIIEKSFQSEGLDNCIKNITIGFTNFDKKINGIENYTCLISKICDLNEKNFGDRLGQNRKFVDSLPQPLENVEYSDSKNVQYLIRGNGNFNLGQIYYSYEDKISEEVKCTLVSNSKTLIKKIK